MHDETKQELISTGTSVMGSLLKEFFIHRNRVNQMQEKKDLELELAKARTGAASDQGTERDDTRRSRPTPEDADLREAFHDLKARENCGICRQLLDAIEHADRRTQIRALTEYGRFQHAVETGASEAEIRDILEQSDTLKNLLEREMGPRPSG